MMQKATATGNWWLAASSQQHVLSYIISCAEYFGETSSHPGHLAPLQPQFGALDLLAFPKSNNTFEKEEILDHQRNSGK